MEDIKKKIEELTLEQKEIMREIGCFCPSPRKGGIRKKQVFLLRELAVF